MKHYKRLKPKQDVTCMCVKFDCVFFLCNVVLCTSLFFRDMPKINLDGFGYVSDNLTDDLLCVVYYTSPTISCS